MRIGIDLVDLPRFKRVIAKSPALKERVFTPQEIAIAAGMAEGRREEFLAGRFAVKEATLKALGTGLSAGITIDEIETLREESGAPCLRLHGKAQAIASALGIRDYRVSITHDGEKAMAMVALL